MKGGRRDMLKMLGAASGAVALTPLVGGTLHASPDVKVPELPWPFKKLRAEVAAERGYAGYYKGACCYGAFDAILSQLREEVGFPYTVMPSEMLIVGEGGIAGTSSICGALMGASTAIFLVLGGMEPKKREEAFALIRELFAWYEQEALPNYRPRTVKFEIKPSAARSPLCHVSVSRWCKATGMKAFSKERSERCGWLTASVAKYTAEMLNAKADGAFQGTHPLSAPVKECRSCHDRGGSLENSRGLMDCTGGCHFTPKAKHP